MATKTQDMPPPGGYQKIPFARIPARKYFSGYQMILGYVGITTFSFYVYYQNYKNVQRDEVEMRSARMALFPLLIAERDREFLKQLSRNRNEEEKLMADVPGWKVGTWYGEPVFKTLPKDTLVDPHFKEFYVHSDYKTFAQRAHIKLWS